MNDTLMWADLWRKKISEMKLKWGTVMIKFWQATTYRKSSIKLPLSNKPYPSNKPPHPPFSGEESW